MTPRKIWKFPFPQGMTVIDIPCDSQVLHVGQQGDAICVWAACPLVPAGPPVRVILVATGDDEPPPNFTHVGTVVGVGGWAVLHAYLECEA